MNDYITCPHCGCDLFPDNCFDIEYYDKKIISYWKGHCTECGKDFSWKEIHLFDRIEDLVEEDNND